MFRFASSGARLRHAAPARWQSCARPPVILLLVLCACSDGRSVPPADTVEAKSSVASPRLRTPAIARVRPAAQFPVLSPGDVVGSREYVGRQVRVTGRCLPTHGGHALGPTMGAMAVWQLEWDGIAVYVVGRAPSSCLTKNAHIDTVTITAIVAEDTLPAIGDLPAAPRRYLVSAGEPPQR